MAGIAPYIDKSNGDTLWEVYGVNAFTDPIVFPTNKPFQVRGRTADAALVYKGDPSLNFIQVSPSQPTDLSMFVDMRQALINLQINGGRVAVNGGGKYFDMERVRVVGNKARKDKFGALIEEWAVKFANYDGGTIDCYIHENMINGLLLDNAHCLSLNVLTRCNNGDGLTVRGGSAALSGRVYAEANGRYQEVWCPGSSRSDLLGGWQEAAWWPATNNPIYAGWIEYAPTQFYGKRRLCYDLNLRGQMQLDSNQAWDDDPVSHHFCPAPKELQMVPGIGRYLAHQAPLIPRLQGWDSTQLEIDANNNVLIHAGAFDNPKRGTVEFVEDPRATLPAGALPLSNFQFSAGDSLVVNYAVASPQWKYLRNTLSACPTIRLYSLDDHKLPLGQNFFVTRPGANPSYTWPTTYPIAGVGPRLFAYVLLGAHGPTQDVTLDIYTEMLLFPSDWK